ncbi:MAG: alpha-glucuronidase family glycosyl hydrolase [Bacteroidia bacterium]|nr:alpha-glucuronidase family glycosyl hydrolase [Bacteroidia bacterium]
MKKLKTIYFIFILTVIQGNISHSETGYKVWLRYQAIDDKELSADYLKYCSIIYQAGSSDILSSSANELKSGLKEMLGAEPVISTSTNINSIIIGTIDKIPSSIYKIPDSQARSLNQEGYIIKNTGKHIIITAKNEVGVLYGTFHLLRLMQMKEPVADIDLLENPKVKLRLLNHWDNPGKIPEERTNIERGYAGISIFKWEELPEINKRYIDYARILSSVGINGAVINNVNTAKKGLEGWKLLTPEYLPKLKALASVFRNYGIKLYISVNFFSPVLISGTDDADPLNPKVQEWWRNKVVEIYSEIPDFGGFLVKADSEGEPGPIKYGRTQAEGANLLANALKPFGGLLMWRAFVYGDKELSPDRACQAYQVFKPLDGAFAENALVQIKNGPIDFQVREPVSPLFGAMPKTNQLLEMQITQEYTGQDKHVCYLVPEWKEILDFDTYAKGNNSMVSRIIDGSLFGYKYSGIAGVSNIGDDQNWTGHLLAQANLYGFGRLAWNPDLSIGQITDEWILQTFGNNEKIHSVLNSILLTSWETYENYTSPLGCGLMCSRNDRDESHFYPAPSKRVDYHKADKNGVGYDRTIATGSGYTNQYFEPVKSEYEDLSTCPDELLLFLHHVPYTYKLKSGKTVIQHIYDSHNEGVEQVLKYQAQWQSLKGLIDDERFEHVKNKLIQQEGYAREWRDSINSYFLDMSGIEDTYKLTNIK